MQLVAGTAIVSGALILLGWFTLPVRVTMLAIFAILAWRSFKRQATSFKQSFRSAYGLRLTSYASIAAALAAALLLWHSGTTDPIRSPWSVVPPPFFFLYAVMAAMSVMGVLAPRAAGSGGLPARREATGAGTVVRWPSDRATERLGPEPTRWGGEGDRAREATRPQQLAGLLSIGATLALTSLVTILVYPIGFGFDHFIHAAAERIIATTGALSPPPLFYSGHYGLTVLLADLLPGVGVDIADRLLTPLLTVAFLIPLAYRSLRSILPDHAVRLGLSSLLIVPFLPLAVSTPQATANVFALATVFLLLERSSISSLSPPPAGRGSVRERVAPFATALASLLSQPMTGIITIAIVSMVFVRRWTKKTRSRFFGHWFPGVFTTVLAIGSVIAIPLAFAIAGRIVPNLDLRVTFDPIPALQRLGSALGDVFTITAVDFSTADALSVARVLLPMLWIILLIIGMRLKQVGHDNPSQGDTASVLRSAFCVLRSAPLIALAAAALVAATVTIPTQLGEEQSQFPLRLVQLAALLATPLAAIGLGTLLSNVFSPSLRRGSDESSIALAKEERGRSTFWYQRIAATFVFSVTATFTLLLAYPRDDAQARSGLWSVSADDIAAVHAVANDAGDTPYVVLANQMLGAAAIREFGFKPAHRLPDGSEILAFPLPAGGPIARTFWEYVSQEVHTCSPPSPLRGEGGLGGERWCTDRTPIDAAVDLVGAQRAYVVIHDYWRNTERLATATAAIADAEIGTFAHLRVFRLIR